MSKHAINATPPGLLPSGQVRAAAPGVVAPGVVRLQPRYGYYSNHSRSAVIALLLAAAMGGCMTENHTNLGTLRAEYSPADIEAIRSNARLVYFVCRLKQDPRIVAKWPDYVKAGWGKTELLDHDYHDGVAYPGDLDLTGSAYRKLVEDAVIFPIFEGTLDCPKKGDFPDVDRLIAAMFARSGATE